MADSRSTKQPTRTRALQRPRSRRHWRVAILGSLAAVALLGAWGLIEPRLLLVDRTVVSSPDIPPEFEGARIVFVADIHGGPYFSRERLRSLVARINAEKPDLVILGGDYVGESAGGASFVYPELARLHATDGTVAVIGNHDIREGRDIATAGLEEAGVTLLDNDNVRVARGSGWIRIAGVDDAWEGQPQLEPAAADIATDEFTIFVTHTPDYLATALPQTRGAFDLALAAHTHGGQVTALGLWAPLMPTRYGQRYRSGWIAEQGIPVLVTRGVGTVHLPVRFFAPPEFHVIRLHRGPASVRQL